MRRKPLAAVREEPAGAAGAAAGAAGAAAAGGRWRRWAGGRGPLYALAAGAGAAAYANSLGGAFVHDDIPAIVSNADVTGAGGARLLLDDFWGTPMADPASHKSYRPLTTLSFRLNYLLCGLSPWWWHAGNVLLHAACCAGVARAAAAVARLRRPFAALAALLFAVHPVHTEAVSGVVGRADLLACGFYLASILLYHGGPAPRVWRSVAAGALGVASKEPALTALLFNVLFDLYRTPRGARRARRGAAARALAALALLAAARLLLLQGALPAFSPQDNPPAFHPDWRVRLLTFSYLSALNCWLLLCPWALSHDWQMGSVPPVTSLLDARNALTAAALLLLLALAVRCYWDLDSARRPALAAGLLLLALPYLPASNLLVTVGFVVAERVLYMPSVGFVILVAYGVQLAWGRAGRGGGRGGRGLLLCGAAALVVAGGARTALRNLDWRTRETLLRADLATLPHNAKLHYNFGNFLKDAGRGEDAIRHYREALRLWPSYASAHNNLGTLLPPALGERHFLLALRHSRDHVNAHYNLGKLYRKRNQLAESARLLERCVALAPRWAAARLELLRLRPDRARRPLLAAVLRLQPRRWEHRLLYGNWWRRRGVKHKALEHYLHAVRLWYRGGGHGGHGGPAGPGGAGAHGGLAALRAAALALRDLGQQARLLQLLIRWHGARDPLGAGARRLLLRGSRLRAELAGRAARYSLTHAAQSASTCVHHSQLEVRRGERGGARSGARGGGRGGERRGGRRNASRAVIHGVSRSCQRSRAARRRAAGPARNRSAAAPARGCPRAATPAAAPYADFVTDQLIQTY